MIKTNRNNKIALSIDLDDWYHTPLVTGSSFSIYKTVDEFFSNWNGIFDLITEPTLRLLDLFKRKSIKATFFVIADEVEKYPEMMKALKKSGHEIACHSLHHQVPIDSKSKELIQTREEWAAELAEARNILENYFEREVIGYRAPGAYFANWMVEPLVEAGFKYDSSISRNSLYNKTNVPLENIPDRPYYLNADDLTAGPPQSGLLEFPLAVTNIFGYRVPTAGAYFFRLLGYHFFRRAIRLNLKKHDTMFYIHSLDFSNEKIPLGNFKSRPFYWINKGEKAWKKFGKLTDYFCLDFSDYFSLSKTNHAAEVM